MEEKISIILVNYNGKAYNDKCIASILGSTLGEQLEVVVVDNGSTDGSLRELETRWDTEQRVHILPLNENYGFSKANNEGMKWALKRGRKYFLLLNNDTEVEVDTVERLFNCHRQTKAIVVPKVLYADRPEIIWCAGGTFSDFIQKPTQRGLDEKDNGQYDEDIDCNFANGCCMFLSNEIIDRLGFLDEKFFLYYEDTEYSLRAGESGVPVRYCAGAKIYHKVNGSTKGNEKPDNAYYITRNWLLCNKMHMSSRRFCLFWMYFLLNRAAWALIWLTQGKKDMIKAMYRGIRDFRSKRYGKYEKGILHSL